MRGALEAVAQLPFARDARRVAGVLEQIAERLLRRIEMAEVRVVAAIADARHQRHARRRAERLHVALLEPHARRGELVHHRRLVALAAIGRDALVAEVVNEDEHDIRLWRRRHGARPAAASSETMKVVIVYDVFMAIFLRVKELFP